MKWLTFNMQFYKKLYGYVRYGCNRGLNGNSEEKKHLLCKMPLLTEFTAVFSVIVNNNSINLLEHEMRKALCNYFMWLPSAESTM